MTEFKKFKLTKKMYDVKIAPLPYAFSGELIIRLMLQVLEAIFEKSSQNWEEDGK